MKWSKFTQFAANNLSLGPCLDWHIGPMALSRDCGSHPAFTFRTWVEKQVEYVAVRPFTSLDLNATDTKGEGRSVRYIGWHHIGNEEAAFSRLRYTDKPNGTIQEMLEGLVIWHSEYWAKQPDRPLVLDAVVRHTQTWIGRGYPRESLEFFLVPENFVPTTKGSNLMKCGCGGEIKEGVGCLTYVGSDDYDLDVMHESAMRSGGLGFGVELDTGQAMMSMHLQSNGFSTEEADAVLLARPSRIAISSE